MFELLPIIVGLAAGGLLAARRVPRPWFGATAVVIGVTVAVVAGELPGEAWAVIVDTATAAIGLAGGGYIYERFFRPASARPDAAYTPSKRLT